VLFGGQGNSAETWEWDGKQWVENRLAVAEGRFNAVMAFERARRVVIRFGGLFLARTLRLSPALVARQ
jgi:hypothetical protein